MQAIAEQNENGSRLWSMGIFDHAVRVKKNGGRLSFVISDVENIGTWLKEIAGNPVFEECYFCGESHYLLQLTFMDSTAGGYVCDKCKKEYYRTCDQCGKLMLFEGRENIHNVIMADNRHGFICGHCFSREYTTCDQCGKNVLNSTMSIRDAMQLCRDCTGEYNKTHARCVDCAEWVLKSHLSDGQCLDCYKESLRRANTTIKQKMVIKQYGKTEGAVFLSTAGGCAEHLGFEIEISDGNICDEMLQESYAFKDLCEFKKDGSVPRGFEIASYPMSLTFHKNKAQWNKLFDIMNKYNFISNDHPSCGFHVHISRLAFGDTPRKQARNIAAFNFLFYRFETQMKKFSRRKGNFNYCEFFSASNFRNETSTRAYQKCVNYNKAVRNTILNFHVWQHVAGRYQAIINKNTVEVRLFKGTLKYSTFIATLQLISMFVKMACEELTNEEKVQSVKWQNVLNNVESDMPELKEYLSKMKLTE